MKEVAMIKKRANAILWHKHIKKNSDSIVKTTKDFYHQRWTMDLVLIEICIFLCLCCFQSGDSLSSLNEQRKTIHVGLTMTIAQEVPNPHLWKILYWHKDMMTRYFCKEGNTNRTHKKDMNLEQATWKLHLWEWTKKYHIMSPYSLTAETFLTKFSPFEFGK